MKNIDFLQSNISYIRLHNRRYIGSKKKLTKWIFSIVNKKCEGNSFADLFAGTGVVSATAAKIFKKVILNDILYSNYVIYQAFFGKGEWGEDKINYFIKRYNSICGKDLEDNYFSNYFGGKYFTHNTSKVIGFVREDIEKNKNNLTKREYYILIASLLYAVDKIANTVGHYDAYLRTPPTNRRFLMRPIKPININEVYIFREDANSLIKRVKADIVYIDPPYNSRQYSRLYHVLETLTKWDKPKLHGVALKPNPENMSDYCRVKAREKLSNLIENTDSNFILVSYNNTYNSKSNSSKNKITLKEIMEILKTKGTTEVFEKHYRHFNAGNTDFKNHKEYLFVCRVKHKYEYQNK